MELKPLAALVYGVCIYGMSEHEYKEIESVLSRVVPLGAVPEVTGAPSNFEEWYAKLRRTGTGDLLDVHLFPFGDYGDCCLVVYITNTVYRAHSHWKPCFLGQSVELLEKEAAVLPSLIQAVEELRAITHKWCFESGPGWHVMLDSGKEKCTCAER